MNTKILIAAITIALFTMSTVNAQEKEQTKIKHEQTENDMYSCPMHAVIKSDKPGSCTKCGMDLKKMEVSHKMQDIDGMKMDSLKMNAPEMVKTFTCPMHPETTSSKLGTCSKCGMKLVEKKLDLLKKNNKK